MLLLRKENLVEVGDFECLAVPEIERPIASFLFDCGELLQQGCRIDLSSG